MCLLSEHAWIYWKIGHNTGLGNLHIWLKQAKLGARLKYQFQGHDEALAVVYLDN